ncbi:hypothetical protein B0H14DRAFT_3466075 [Mycena olivaceomarginata]|nr:hypothetical protein B0H14DRAFT_3466075 [Mycena olivaceomarginata]
MPATEQTSRTYACGLSLPLPADFVFRAYRKTSTELSVRGSNRILYWDANTVRPHADHPSMGEWVVTWWTKGRSRTTLTPTTSPNSNPAPPSADSVSHVKEDSVAPVVSHNSQQWQQLLNGRRQSIVEDDPNTASRVMSLSSALTSPVQTAFSPVMDAAPYLTTTLHTDISDTDFVLVKTSGAQFWRPNHVLELTNDQRPGIPQKKRTRPIYCCLLFCSADPFLMTYTRRPHVHSLLSQPSS